MNDEEKILTSLQNIEELLTILVKNQLSNVVEKTLSNDKKKKLYQLTGKYGVKEIAQKLNCSYGWISGVWKDWECLGLIVKDGNKYRKIL